ncbi:MAG: hypothetical protein ABIR76_09000 [Polaromonas sp.]
MYQTLFRRADTQVRIAGTFNCRNLNNKGAKSWNFFSCKKFRPDFPDRLVCLANAKCQGMRNGQRLPWVYEDAGPFFHR